MNNNDASPTRRTAMLLMVVAFAAGLGLAFAISWWERAEEPAPAIHSTAPAIVEQRTTVTHVGPVAASAPALKDRDSRSSGATVPNPFQRLARGVTPDPRGGQRAVQASTAAYVPYQVSQTYAPVVTRDWVRKLRSSCAQQAERERSECERVADLIERMLANTEGVDEGWASAMQAELQRLFSSSTRAKDFALQEVTCNANGCILYWHSNDYADWKGAGNVLVKDLLERSGFAEFDLRNFERLGEFDPTTSIPWEMLVLERRAAEP